MIQSLHGEASKPTLIQRVASVPWGLSTDFQNDFNWKGPKIQRNTMRISKYTIKSVPNKKKQKQKTHFEDFWVHVLGENQKKLHRFVTNL